MIDTHCHLNFEAFENNLDEIITKAKSAGITHFVIPGTDIPTSKKACEIANTNEDIFAAIGIHPHHAFAIQNDRSALPMVLKEIDALLDTNEVSAIGEIGLDMHVYESTKYEDYTITPEFLEMQKRLFTHQLFLAAFIKKPVIIHSRDAADWMIELITSYWNEWFHGKMVFHCCEANEKLLGFAKDRNIFIGVDGDVTYSKKKAAFIKEVPLELLVLETDAPYLTPEPARQTIKFPNTPKNLIHTAAFIAELKGITVEELDQITTQNAVTLFGL